MFKFSVRSETTRKYYERRIIRFFDFIEFDSGGDAEERCNQFAEKSRNDVNWVLNRIVIFLQFQKERTVKGEITAATLSNFVKAIKIFCEMSDIAIPWKKITRGLPRASQSANDRAPDINEIRKLIEYPDRRIKPIIYTMVSSGIRIGAWDSLQWKHISPITDTGYSWYKRIILLPFLATFVDDKDVNKIEELTTAEELSGFLNSALIGLKQLVKDGDFANIEDARTVKRLFDDILKNITEFILKKCVRSSSTVEYCEDVYKAYCQYCKSNGIIALENNTLVVYLHEMGIQKIRPMVGGIRKYAYKGIKLNQG